MKSLFFGLERHSGRRLQLALLGVAFQTAPSTTTPASGTAQQPLIDAGTQIGTPVATTGFGAREDTDATRQAQHMEANDAPLDVNMNSVVGREQAGTFTLTGKQFAASAARLESIDNANLDWREIHKGRLFGAKAAN